MLRKFFIRNLTCLYLYSRCLGDFGDAFSLTRFVRNTPPIHPFDPNGESPPNVEASYKFVIFTVRWIPRFLYSLLLTGFSILCISLVTNLSLVQTLICI